MFDAGSVVASLGGQFRPGGFTQFSAAMKKAEAEMNATERAIRDSGRRSGQSMTAMGVAANKGAAVGLAALGAATVFSVKKAMDFEAAMSDVQSVTKASSRDFQRLSDSAKRLGADTGVGATKAAGALAELAKGGLSTQQTIGALAGTIAMSQAGSMDLAEAATTVAQALNLFNLEGGDASHVADAFATAANKTTADVGFFAQGLAQGGAAAKSAGLSFDETTAALEILAANGFKSGSDAGTSLKTSLIQLANPSKKAADLTKKLGLEFFTQSGEMKSLAGISTMLRDKFDGLSRKQRLAAAATLVGTDGMRALLALYDQGPGKIQNFERGLKAQGTAGDVAKTKTDNLAGSWRRFNARMETVGINLGDKLVPKLEDAAKAADKFLQQFDADKGEGAGGAFKNIADAASDASNISWDFLKEGARATQYLLDVIGNYHPKPVELTAKLADEASPALERLQKKSLAPKVQKILADDSSPREKYEALRRLKVPDKVARLILQTGGVNQAIAELNKIPHTVTVTAKLRDEASQILNNIINKPLREKVSRIIANTDDVKSKVAALEALGISGPTANFLANTVSIVDAQHMIAGQRFTVPVTYVPNVLKPTLPGGLPTKKKARGSGPDPGVALVGEGTGAELAGNLTDGFRRVDRPTLMGLGPDDWVLPVEQFPQRALGMVLEMLGLQGYAKGKKPKKKPRQHRPHPKHVDPIAYSEYLGPLEATVQQAQASVTRDEAAKDAKDKKGKRTKAAKQARARLGEERRKLKAAKAELASAKTYGNRIAKFEDLANIYADDMTRADNADDGKAYNRARLKREKALGSEQKLLVRALNAAGGANATSAWARALRKKIGETDIAISETLKASPNDEDAASDSTFTKPEQERLDKIESDIALAALTDTKADDLAAETKMVEFLGPLLAEAQASGGAGRGGAPAITDIAGQLKSAQDAIKDLTRTPDLTADQQASADQREARGYAAGLGANIDRLVGATLAGAGPSLVFQSYVPPSPSEALRLADHVVSGVNFQGGRPSSKERMGI